MGKFVEWHQNCASSHFDYGWREKNNDPKSCQTRIGVIMFACLGSSWMYWFSPLFFSSEVVIKEKEYSLHLKVTHFWQFKFLLTICCTFLAKTSCTNFAFFVQYSQFLASVSFFAWAGETLFFGSHFVHVDIHAHAYYHKCMQIGCCICMYISKAQNLESVYIDSVKKLTRIDQVTGVRGVARH